MEVTYRIVEVTYRIVEVTYRIVKVTHREWAALIPAVPKRDGTYHICGDYNITVNPALDMDPTPTAQTR